ncbi:MAG: beta-galactosidase [Bryobacteraceae bacterium]
MKKHILLLLFLAAVAYPSEIARWEAGAPAKGITVTPSDGTTWTTRDEAGVKIAAIEPSADYFSMAGVRVEIQVPVTGAAWLVVEYLDRGYALITTSPGVAQRRQRGVARLNTGKFRRAVFEFDGTSLKEPIIINGAGFLRSISVFGSEPPVETTPSVPPAVKFSRPSQRVTTAGADASSPEDLPETLAAMRNLLPLAKALGFNGIESYVKWNFIERSPGVFDWSFYDAVVDELDKHGMQWFPLLIVGSAYTLPEWFHDSADNKGYVCLEHGQRNDIQTIFCGHQDRYVRRFLQEFGKHYGNRKTLLGIRLGPSGNYGEAQYPARGDWGYKGQPLHTHIGYWAGDACAAPVFRNWLRRKYPSISELNRAWGDSFQSFEDIKPFLPETAATLRKRADFADWYMGAMTRWCEQWAEWAREAMPNTVIHQSSGGWGPIEIGTDYTGHAKTMARLKGGVRLTNESDNFAQNFTITRMASSAARFYGAALGYEPGGFGSARGVMARLFNCVTNNGEHLFYYPPNLYDNDQAIDRWLSRAYLLDRRAKPATDIAAFYPDTGIELDDEVLRHMWGNCFLTRAEAMRSTADYDYVSEPMVQDGALDRYKVLIFLWGHVTEKSVLDRVAKWVEEGGVLFYMGRPRGPLQTVEGDLSVWQRWQRGETGKGRVIIFPGDPEPGQPYARYVRDQLRKLNTLRPEIQRAVRMEKPGDVYWSVLENGLLLLLNFGDDEAEVRLDGGKTVRLAPYTIETLEAGW